MARDSTAISTGLFRSSRAISRPATCGSTTWTRARATRRRSCSCTATRPGATSGASRSRRSRSRAAAAWPSTTWASAAPDKPPLLAALHARGPRGERARARRRARPARRDARGPRLGRPRSASARCSSGGSACARPSSINTWAWELPSFLPPFLREFRTEGLGEILALAGNLFVESIPGGMASRDTDPVMMEAYRAPFPDYWSRIGTLAFQRDIPLTERDRSSRLMGEIHDRLHGLDLPVTLVWGMRDPRVPAGLPRAVARAVPRGPGGRARRCGALRAGGPAGRCD